MYCVRTLDACACACAFVLSVGVCGISYFSCNSPVNFNAFVFFSFYQNGTILYSQKNTKKRMEMKRKSSEIDWAKLLVFLFWLKNCKWSTPG